jgi:hypothetical protein
MSNTISPVSSQMNVSALQTAAKPQPVKAKPAAEVTPNAPVNMIQGTQTEEVKETPAMKAAEALKTIASQEAAQPTSTPPMNTVSPESVIAAYKQG